MYLDNDNLIVDGDYGGSSVFWNYDGLAEQDHTIASVNEASISVSFSDGRTGLLRFEGVDDVSITSGIGGKHTVELRCDGFTLTLIDDNQLTEADFEGVDELL